LGFELYRRRRRLAVVISAASAILLAGWMSLGKFPETYSHPSIIPTANPLYITHRA
jgi:hypothetical protein